MNEPGLGPALVMTDEGGLLAVVCHLGAMPRVLSQIVGRVRSGVMNGTIATVALAAALVGASLANASPVSVQPDPSAPRGSQLAGARPASLYLPLVIRPAQRSVSQTASTGPVTLFLPAVVKPGTASATPGLSAPAQRAAARLNFHRALAGLPARPANPLLTRAAENHASYYVLNFGDPTLQGMGLHRETAGRPGFTGVEPEDRAQAAGYPVGMSVTVDENVGLVGDPERLVDAFVDTVNHRWNMIHPSLVDLGYAVASKPAIDVLKLGFTWTKAGHDRPGRYPGPNQSGVPVSSHIWETPDPAPGVPRPLGYPITVAFPLYARVTFGTPTLRTESGESLEHVATKKEWLRGLSIIPTRPLQPQTRYVVTVPGARDGVPFTETWSFTTR